MKKDINKGLAKTFTVSASAVTVATMLPFNVMADGTEGSGSGVSDVQEELKSSVAQESTVADANNSVDDAVASIEAAINAVEVLDDVAENVAKAKATLTEQGEISLGDVSDNIGNAQDFADTVANNMDAAADTETEVVYLVNK